MHPPRQYQQAPHCIKKISAPHIETVERAASGRVPPSEKWASRTSKTYTNHPGPGDVILADQRRMRSLQGRNSQVHIALKKISDPADRNGREGGGGGRGGPRRGGGGAPPPAPPAPPRPAPPPPRAPPAAPRGGGGAGRGAAPPPPPPPNPPRAGARPQRETVPDAIRYPHSMVTRGIVKMEQMIDRKVHCIMGRASLPY